MIEYLLPVIGGLFVYFYSLNFRDDNKLKKYTSYVGVILVLVSISQLTLLYLLIAIVIYFIDLLFNE